MTKRALLFSIITLGLVALSCKKDTTIIKEPTSGNNFTMDVKLISNGNQVLEGQVVELKNGNDINVSDFSIYFSNIALHQQNGTKVPLKDIMIFKPAETSSTSAMSVNIDPAQAYTAISFGLGVDSILNESDPSSFNQDHPLATYQNMYWNMLKYRFVKFEAKGNTRGNLGQTDDAFIAYHTGTNTLYREITLPYALSPIGDAALAHIDVRIDVDSMFCAHNNELDIFDKDESTHSEPSDFATAVKVTDNLSISLSVEGSTTVID